MFNVFVAAALSEPVEIYGAPRCAPAHRRATASPARSEKVRSPSALSLACASHNKCSLEHHSPHSTTHCTACPAIARLPPMLRRESHDAAPGHASHTSSRGPIAFCTFAALLLTPDQHDLI